MTLHVASGSKARRVVRSALFLALSAGLFATACGGRWRTYHEVPLEDDDELGGRGNSQAGASTITAGSSGVAGPAVACDRAPCPDVDCGHGSTLVTLPGECCPTCQSLCGDTACEPCPPGTHAGMMTRDQCCPACIKDTVISPAACDAGKMTYQPVRDRVVYKAAAGCTSDSECRLSLPMNRCEAGCDYVTVYYGSLGGLQDAIQMEADMDCAACPQTPLPMCPPPPMMPHCYSGQCGFSPP